MRVEFHFNASADPFVSSAILARTPLSNTTRFQAVVQVESELGMVVAHGAPVVVSGFLLSSLSRGVELALADVCQVGAWGFNAAMLYGACVLRTQDVHVSLCLSLHVSLCLS